MLRNYFNQNDPFKAMGLVLLLLFSRSLLGFVVWDEVFGQGVWIEQMQNAPQNITEWYQGHSGPVYQLLWLAFPKLLLNPVVNVILSSLLLLFLALRLNAFLIKWAAFEHSSYLPAALMIIFSISLPELYVVSAPLVGAIFLLLALQLVFSHLRQNVPDENILSTGFLTGLAGMIFLPYLWFLLVLLIVYALFSSTGSRRYLLMLWGMCMPWLVLGLFFGYRGEMSIFWEGIAVGMLRFELHPSELLKITVALGFPFLMALYAAFQSLSGMGMNNFQMTIRAVFLWIGLFALVLTFWFSGNVLGSVFMLTLPMSYFVNQALQKSRKKRYADGLFYLLLMASFLALIFAHRLT